MVSDGRSRRSVLRRTVALAAAGALASLAGCGGSGDGGGDGNGGDGSNGGDGGPAQSFHRWLHAPGKTIHKEHYGFFSVKPVDVEAHADALSDDRLSQMRERQREWEPTGVEYGDAERALSLQSSRVVRATFDREVVGSSLTDAGYERQDGEEFDVYAGDGQAVGVGDEVLVFGEQTLDVEAAGAVEVTIDAWQGEIERYPQVNENMATLLDRLGDGTIVFGSTRGEQNNRSDTLEGDLRATGTRFRLDGDVTDYLGVFVFAKEARGSDMKSYLDRFNEPHPLSKLNERGFRTSGRVGIAEGSLNTASF